MDSKPGARDEPPLIVPLPAGARLLTRRPLPIVVAPGVWFILGLAIVMGVAFALLNSITLGRDYPSVGQVVAGVAIAMLWPAALILHELGHAVAGIVVRPPVWLRLGLVPATVLTPPPSNVGRGFWCRRRGLRWRSPQGCCASRSVPVSARSSSSPNRWPWWVGCAC